MDKPNETGSDTAVPTGGDSDGNSATPDTTEQAQLTDDEGAGQGTVSTSPATEHTKREETSRGAGVWGKVVLLLLLAALVGGGFSAWQWWQQAGSGTSNQALSAMLEQQQGQLGALQQQLDGEVQDWAQRFSAQAARSDALTARLASQEELLRDLSASGREDLILAEAEFLLRLANQRLLSERQPGAALALLENSDRVLAEVDDAGLFAVRKALAQDISALRLAATVDREGLYLQLVALGEAVAKLQSLPRLTDMATPTVIATTQESFADDAVPEGAQSTPESPRWYTRLLANARHALQRFSEGYLTIRRLDRPMTPMLSADRELLLNHSLRLALEQAELALLREEQEVYVASLNKAEQWLQTYYQLIPESQVLIAELQGLKTQDIVQKLPDISGSLDALRHYQRARQTRKSALVATP